ncbi:MAG: DUF2905 domain-containing protein [Candidatus Omnitrophica bacterium]|nr:DUF2905 domain-containing protein [Candidatus Omnitrophota bacterium]
MSSVAKTIILAGTIIASIGILFLFSDKIPWLGRLPGDINIEKENFTLYFPFTTCVILSVIISAIFFLITRR